MYVKPMEPHCFLKLIKNIVLKNEAEYPCMGGWCFPQNAWVIKWKYQCQVWNAFMNIDRGGLRGPQNHKDYWHCFQLSSVVRWITLLLKILHTLIWKQIEIKLGLTWKLALCWQAFIMLEGAMKTTKGETSSIDLPCGRSYMLYYQTVTQDVSTGTIVIWLLLG